MHDLEYMEHSSQILLGSGKHVSRSPCYVVNCFEFMVWSHGIYDTGAE